MLKVNRESGYSGCDRPKSVEMDRERHEVREIARERREPGAKHYRVRIHGGRQF